MPDIPDEWVEKGALVLEGLDPSVRHYTARLVLEAVLFDLRAEAGREHLTTAEAWKRWSDEHADEEMKRLSELAQFNLKRARAAESRLHRVRELCNEWEVGEDGGFERGLAYCARELRAALEGEHDG